MTYRDEAVAAAEAAAAAAEADRQAQEDDLVADARKAAKPLFMKDGILLDPLPATTVNRVDLARSLVLFDLEDGSALTIAVYLGGESPKRFLVDWIDGEPVKGDRVESLEDVGASLLEDEEV